MKRKSYVDLGTSMLTDHLEILFAEMLMNIAQVQAVIIADKQQKFVFSKSHENIQPVIHHYSATVLQEIPSRRTEELRAGIDSGGTSIYLADHGFCITIFLTEYWRDRQPLWWHVHISAWLQRVQALLRPELPPDADFGAVFMKGGHLAFKPSLPAKSCRDRLISQEKELARKLTAMLDEIESRFGFSDFSFLAIVDSQRGIVLSRTCLYATQDEENRAEQLTQQLLSFGPLLDEVKQTSLQQPVEFVMIRFAGEYGALYPLQGGNFVFEIGPARKKLGQPNTWDFWRACWLRLIEQTLK